MNFYMFLKKIFSKIMLGVIYRCHVTGVENIPESGGALIAANHISMSDVVIIGAASKRQVYYMAKKELFKFKPFGALIRKLGAFPVDRGGGGKGIAAIKNSVSIIEDGRIVGIFPQGTRKKHVFPGDTKIHSGVGMIQAKTGCPVIPVSIQTKNYRVIPFFRKIYLTIGKPMRNEDFADLDDREDRYKLISDRIFGKIVSQLKQ